MKKYCQEYLDLKIKKDLLATSKTKIAHTASFKYEGIRLLKRYWPAVSHSCNLQVVPLYVIFFPTKSIPIVGFVMMSVHFISLRIDY